MTHILYPFKKQILHSAPSHIRRLMRVALLLSMSVAALSYFGPIGHATINGYVEAAYGCYQAFGDCTNAITYITADWTVPQAPSNTNGNPVNILFVGIQNSTANWIAQPVLAWGKLSGTGGGQIGGNYWYITAYFDYGGNSTGIASSIVQVNSGDQIAGYASGGTFSQCNGGIGYHILIDDNSIGKATDEYRCTGEYGYQAYIAFESYFIANCNNLPNSDSEQFYQFSTTPSPLLWNTLSYAGSPSCSLNQGPTTTVHIHSYPTTDTFSRSHGKIYDQTLPVPWWPPYASDQFKVTASTFDYSENVTFALGSSHYIQEAASGFTPNNAWHTQIYVSRQLKGEGDVGRNQILQVNFTANGYTLYWTP